MKFIPNVRHIDHDTSTVPIPPTGDFLLEVPKRVELLERAFRSVFGDTDVPVRDLGMAPIEAVHSIEYLDFLRNVPGLESAESTDSPQAVFPDIFPPRRPLYRSGHPSARRGWYASDTFSPLLAGTWSATYHSAQAALTGAAEIGEGARRVYALSRPPGHHAYADRYGGFCYLNNAAVAARHLRRTSFPDRRVAILDIDFHHGNGTQEIFYRDADVAVVSVHGDPETSFPYFSGAADERGEDAGESFNLNIPLSTDTGDDDYLRALDRALDSVCESAALVVSLGFDTAEGDPYGSFRITRDGFRRIGRRLSELPMPLLVIQEGGYFLARLEENARAFFEGMSASL